MAVYNNYKPLNLLKPLWPNVGVNIANLDKRYGPYSDKDSAYDAILEWANGETTNIPIGLTVGIQNGDNIIEYWFQNGTEKDNLTIKNNQIWK